MTNNSAASARRNRLIAALSPSDQSIFHPHLETLSIKQGTLLREAGEPIDQVYFPQEGMISLLAIMRDGQAIETATVGNEGVVGAMSRFMRAGR
jgi:CRP-like cAMP-binding protein